MLVLDIYQNANGDVTIQYNPKQWENIRQLRNCLDNYVIENPLVTFSNRYNGDYYKRVPEEYVQADAWVSDTLGKFWKNSDDDIGQPSQNALIILSRLTDAYLDEHYELLELREKSQKRSPRRKRKEKQPRDDKTNEDDYHNNIVVADLMDFIDPDDPAMQPFDPYAYGIGLCCVKYSDYLLERMHISNDVSLRCHDEGSDEGIVTYMADVSYRQSVTVIFTYNEPFVYDVDLYVDTYGDEDLDPESLYDVLSAKDRRIQVPFTGGLVIEPVIEKIEGAMQLCVGVRLSYKIRFTNDVDEISATRMRNIYVTTRAMLQFIEADIKSVI